MEGGLVLLGGGGGGGGGGGSCGFSTNESTVVSKVEAVSEASSYPAESELELGLGLSLGGGGGATTGKYKGTTSSWADQRGGRILTAKDFPPVVSHHRAANNGGVPPPSVAVSGTKRAAETVAHDGGSPTAISQVVGWPPIRAYRINSLVNQAKSQTAEEDNKGIDEEDKSMMDGSKKKQFNGKQISSGVNEKGRIGFVKVNMDGIRIGRKVDLNAHSCYESLAQALEDMFLRSANSVGAEKEQVIKPSKLLDGSSEFVLTYEDKEGDWMLVGDVPWRMFLSSVRRLRIMRTSEANGLTPRLHERNEGQRCKPI